MTLQLTSWAVALRNRRRVVSPLALGTGDGFKPHPRGHKVSQARLRFILHLTHSCRGDWCAFLLVLSSFVVFCLVSIGLFAAAVVGWGSQGSERERDMRGNGGAEGGGGEGEAGG